MLTIRERTQPLARSLLAVLGSGKPIRGGQLAMLRAECPKLGGTRALFASAREDLNSGVREILGLISRCVALGPYEVADGPSLVPSNRLKVTGVSDRIPLPGGVQPCSGAVLALLGRVLPDIARYVVFLLVTAGRKLTVTRRLITVGGILVGVRAGLVGVRTCLITV